MLKELSRIQNTSNELMKGFPAKLEERKIELRAAEDELEQAKDRLEAAENIEEYDRASAEIKRAELVVKFAKTALEKLESAPRMDESEYNSAVETCTGIMDKAAAEYRKKTTALMEQLKAVKNEYMAIAKDVNNTLVTLDNAANVLQSRYPCREYKYVNAPSEFEKDPNAWREHAVRYDNGRPYHLATIAEDPVLTGLEKFSKWGPIYDKVLENAWRAVDRAYD